MDLILIETFEQVLLILFHMKWLSKNIAWIDNSAIRRRPRENWRWRIDSVAMTTDVCRWCWPVDKDDKQYSPGQKAFHPLLNVLPGPRPVERFLIVTNLIGNKQSVIDAAQQTYNANDPPPYTMRASLKFRLFTQSILFLWVLCARFDFSTNARPLVDIDRERWLYRHKVINDVTLFGRGLGAASASDLSQLAIITIEPKRGVGKTWNTENMCRASSPMASSPKKKSNCRI